MKRFYLSRNNFSNEFYLDSGAFGSRRDVLGKDEDFLISALKEKIDRKRNSQLYILKEDFPENYIKDIRKFFSDSKVKVDLESLANISE